MKGKHTSVWLVISGGVIKAAVENIEIYLVPGRLYYSINITFNTTINLLLRIESYEGMQHY